MRFHIFTLLENSCVTHTPDVRVPVYHGVTPQGNIEAE